MTRRAATILAGIVAVPILVLSCSYETLTIFFDGVPEPGSEVVVAEAPEEVEAQAPSQGSTHAPLRQQKCRSCHRRGSARAIKTAQEGLCAKCHANVTRDLTYVHGPVAVSACDVCHHPHRSRNPHLLLLAPTELCTSCHDPADLGEGEHHNADSGAACLDCHSGHGGEDPYFLK